MTISDEDHRRLSEFIVDHCKTEYTSLADTWRSLEQKAQGTTAIVGIFLAAATLLFGQADQLPALAGYSLVGAVIFLVLSVLFALWSLLVRDFQTVEGTEDVIKAAEDVLGAHDDREASKTIPAYVTDRTAKWQEANTALHEQNQKKAKAVGRAQILLMIAVVLLLVVFVFAFSQDAP